MCTILGPDRGPGVGITNCGPHNLRTHARLRAYHTCPLSLMLTMHTPDARAQHTHMFTRHARHARRAHSSPTHMLHVACRTPARFSPPPHLQVPRTHLRTPARRMPHAPSLRPRVPHRASVAHQPHPNARPCTSVHTRVHAPAPHVSTCHARRPVPPPLGLARHRTPPPVLARPTHAPRARNIYARPTCTRTHLHARARTNTHQHVPTRTHTMHPDTDPNPSVPHTTPTFDHQCWRSSAACGSSEGQCRVGAVVFLCVFAGEGGGCDGWRCV